MVELKKIKRFLNASSIPDDSNMNLCFILQTGENLRKTATIEYLCGAVLVSRQG